MMRIGFVAWNKFQIAQVAPILRSDDELVLIFQQDRPGADMSIPEDPPDWCSVLVMKRQAVSELDGMFDAILTQTSSPETAGFTRTRIIAVQYSMAKERHQYGPWHFMADGRLSYGPYSHGILDFYGNSFPVGNPRFDILFNDRMDGATLDRLRDTIMPAKKTVLYVPTYGKLSSFEAFRPMIRALSETYNVIVSGHHNTMLRETERSRTIAELHPGNSADITPYYYAIADVVISDYSGAIFDAILARKPVVLFRPDHDTKIGVENLTEDSIEIARTSSIGEVVASAPGLQAAIENALEHNSFAAQNSRLRESCFSNIGTSCDAARGAIADIVDHAPQPPKAYQWTRRAIQGSTKIRRAGNTK